MKVGTRCALGSDRAADSGPFISGLKDYGDSERKAYLPVTSADHWIQIVVSAYVSNGQCTIELYSDAHAG